MSESTKVTPIPATDGAVEKVLAARGLAGAELQAYLAQLHVHKGIAPNCEQQDRECVTPGGLAGMKWRIVCKDDEGHTYVGVWSRCTAPSR